MNLHGFLFRLLCVLIPIAAVANTYLYLYPLFHRCAFAALPSKNGTSATAAPFRLLAFGDPQLEGNTALPNAPDLASFDRLQFLEHLEDGEVRSAMEHLWDPVRDSALLLKYHVGYWRKQLDLVGNDYYLAHIYRTLHWYSEPTHVTVLGDLLGSQWIDDTEFSRRSWRFWNRVFRGSNVVPDNKLSSIAAEDGTTLIYEEDLGLDKRWSNWIINVAGNHDIGYAGDIKEDRITRFEREFGPVNGDIRFKLATGNGNTSETSPAIRLVVLNSMNLDSPQQSQELAGETISAINRVMTASRPVGTHDEAIILLTHIPLYKKSGICADDPMFSYFEDGSIKEQNTLSYDTGRDAILQGIYGKHPSVKVAARGVGRDGIILTGHDHEGCDIYHSALRETGSWTVQKWTNADTSELVSDPDVPGIREVTVRSMMGEFGGNTALVSAWWDEDALRWKIEVRNCGFVVQHIWWAVHILDIVILVIWGVAVMAYIWHKSHPVGTGRRTNKIPATTKSSLGQKVEKTPKVDRTSNVQGNGGASIRKKRKKPI
jgi:hypothetical protein